MWRVAFGLLVVFLDLFLGLFMRCMKR